MIITCEQCQARFRLADEKLKPGGTKVRCSKCKHVFLVMPPEAPPEEEAVDFGTFNMESVNGEEPAAVQPEQRAAEPAASSTAPAGETDLDFSGLEQSMGPGSGGDAYEEDFSFADTTVTNEPPPTDQPDAAGAAQPTSAPQTAGADDFAGGLDFDATFAETEISPPEPSALGEPAEFTFDAGASADASATPPADDDAFHFEAEPTAPAADSISFDEPAFGTAGSDFSFADETGGGLEFGGETTAPGEADSFSTGEPAETSPFGEAAALDEEGAGFWDKPEAADSSSFDFDEPSFETQAEDQPLKRGEDAGLSFGEIDFANESDSEPPAFGREPDFSQATLARPATVEEPPAPAPAPPSPRPSASRARGEEPLSAPAMSRKSPMSRVLLTLILLLLILCGAGGYFFFMGNGKQVIDNLILKIKGEEPVAPVEQRIGLNIAESSYVDNRDAGQLLVIQGSATNNFAGARSAITVKGLILDAGGKIIQQQTVFCGNYLSEEKLRTMKYAQIEEAMNNQFGDSLVNMNVKPTAEIRFTIVFRNVPKEMASINVEVVDSKPGGL